MWNLVQVTQLQYYGNFRFLKTQTVLLHKWGNIDKGGVRQEQRKEEL